MILTFAKCLLRSEANVRIRPLAAPRMRLRLGVSRRDFGSGSCSCDAHVRDVLVHRFLRLERYRLFASVMRMYDQAVKLVLVLPVAERCGRLLWGGSAELPSALLDLDTHSGALRLAWLSKARPDSVGLLRLRPYYCGGRIGSCRCPIRSARQTNRWHLPCLDLPRCHAKQRAGRS